MPSRQVRVARDAREVLAAIEALRAELGVPADYPPAAAAEARAAARSAPLQSPARVDLTALPFVTIDPPGSMDLDQAVFIERNGDGYTVHYAIADVGAFVTPGGALDAEVHSRGTTLYAPDRRTPLHPPILSEGAASLLPGVERPAAAWRIDLDAGGDIVAASVRRAVVRSHERLTYAAAQARITGPDAVPGRTAPGGPVPGVSESLALLRPVGELRMAAERARGGVSLNVPDTEITLDDDGSFGLQLRSALPAEDWNAQISLLTGIAAAALMRRGGVGVFRALPPADPRDVARLRHTAAALGIAWPPQVAYGDVLAFLDSTIPAHAAFLTEAVTLFRGASYVPFGAGGAEPGVPDDANHAAIAAEYAHVTAPLRRLVDRYGTEVCLALCAGAEVPPWVREGLPRLPEAMTRAARRAGAYERGILDAVEAALLTGREGELFDGVIVDVDTGRPPARVRGQIEITDPPVRARIEGLHLPLGEAVRATLREVSIERRKVTFALP